MSDNVNIPSDWDHEKLEDICSLVADGTHFSPQSKSGPFRYVTSKNIRFGRMDLSNCEYISEEEHGAIYQRCPVKKGDLLLTKDGANTGNAAINLLTEEFSLLSSVALIRGKPDRVLNSYLLQYILSPKGQFQIKSEMAGLAITRLTLTTINRLRIPIPPLPEQRKIAAILTAWDDALALLDRRIAAAEQRKRGLMQRLLTGQVRFPEFAGQPWREVRLGKIGGCIRGVSYTPQDDLRSGDKENTVRLLRANNIYEGQINIDDLQFVISDRCKDLQYLRQSDIAICMASGSKNIVGKAASFNLNDGFTYTVGAFCAIFRINDTVLASYISQFFQSTVYRRKLLSLTAGSSINNLKPSDIENIRLQMPSTREEQRRIAAVLSTCDRELDLLRRKRAAVAQQKQGLMQRLLTGQVRVKV